MSTLLKAGAVTASIAGLVLANLGIADHPVNTSPITAQQSRDSMFSDADTGGHTEQAADLSEPSFVETFSRPLFAKDRRRWEPPPPSKPPPKRVVQPEKPAVRQIDRPDFNLIGVSISSGAAKALVRRNSELDPVWVLEGEAVGGWIVSAIDSQSISVRQKDQTVSINLYPDVSANQ